MLLIESNLTVELNGRPCLRLQTEGDALVLRFDSRAAFREAISSLRAVPRSCLGGLDLSRFSSWLAQPVVIKVGDAVVGEIVPGEPTSMVARLAGLSIPGLRLRGGELVRSLVAGD